MFVIVAENERFVLAGIAFSRMQSAILLVVFQRRADEAFVVRGEVVPNGDVPGEVVPNGDVVVEVLPAAGAAEPLFVPESEEVARSKMPFLPAAFEEDDDLPEEDDVVRPPPLELPSPVRFWAASGRAARQRLAASAKQAPRFIGFMLRFLSGLRFSSSGCCGRIVFYKGLT